ncbi:MAG: amidohydrolase family protein [Pirellulales bacterium]|nr:amidohydrolase family protein [Pirellulales bacterium]
MRTIRVLLAMVVVIGGTRVLRASDEIPGAPQQKPIAIVGGTIHPVSGPDIAPGTLLLVEGKIAAIGADVPLPDDCEKIDATGKHVYPGMLHAHTQLGIVEIPAVRATVDQAETGSVNPNVKAQVAVNPDSELFPVARGTGILTALVVPGPGVIAGQTAVMNLDGWTYEEMTVRSPAALAINWPRMHPANAWYIEETSQQQLEARDRSLSLLRDTFADARSYKRAKEAHAASQGPAIDHDLRWEAMIPVLAGEVPLLVMADEVAQIQAAVAFAQRERVKLIIAGGYDAPLCAELLTRQDVPVIIAGVHRLPQRESDDYDSPFTLAERLRQAGVKFCIAGHDRHSKAQNMPYEAGTAAAYGLPKADALRAVTLSPAEILGVADRLGSLDSGKDATLFIADGDPLETPTQVEMAFIQGRRVDLSSKHTRLWEKYKEKYRRLGIEN